MITQIPRKQLTLFLGHYKNMNNLRRSFQKQREEIYSKMGNPRLLQIHFHTLRHWKATMEYHKTRDILHGQLLLDHRGPRNTLIYINLEKALFQNTDDEFHVKVAQNLDDACKLLEVGFENVTDMDGTKLSRKRK